MAITVEDLRVMVSATDNATGPLSGIASMMDGVGNNALRMGDNITAGLGAGQIAIAAFGAASAIGLAVATYEAAKFEKEMAIVSATSDVSGEALKKVGNEAMALGQKYGVSAVEVAKGLQILGRAGVESAVQMKVLESALEMSKMEDMPVEEASENLVNIVKMYGDSLENVTRYSDALVHGSKISTVSISDLMEAMKFAGGDAKTLGWTMENLVATFATLGEQGLDSQMVGTTMRGVLGMLIKETPRADEQLAKIGLTFDSFKDSSGKIKQPLEVITTLYDALFKKFGDVKTHGQEWASFLNKAFPGAVGGKAVRLFTGMEEGGGTGLLGKYTEKMNEAYDASEDVSKAMDSAWVQAEKLWVAFTNLLIKLGDGFLPVLKLLVSGMEGLIGFFNANQWAVNLLAGSMTALAIAGLAVVAMWAKQYVMAGLSGMYSILQGAVGLLIGEKTWETRALDANTLAWIRNINAQRGAAGQSALTMATGVGMGGRSGGAAGAFGALGSALGLGTVGTLGVLLLVVGAIMLIIWALGEKDKRYKELEANVKEYNDQLKKQTDREKELNKLIESSPDGSAQQKKYRDELKKTQGEIDKTIEKIHNQNLAIYKERGSDFRYSPGMMRDYKGSTFLTGGATGGGSGWESGSVYLAGAFAGGPGSPGSIAAGSENAINVSAGKWYTDQREQMIASAYGTVLPQYGGLIDKQRSGAKLSESEVARVKELDRNLAKIVGKDNVESVKHLYVAEQKLQKARNRLADAEMRAFLAILRLVGAIFGIDTSSKDASKSGKDAGITQEDLSAQIEDTATKAETAANTIEKLVTKMETWVSSMEAQIQFYVDAWEYIKTFGASGLGTLTETTDKDGNKKTVYTKPKTAADKANEKGVKATGKANIKKGSGVYSTGSNSPLTIKRFGGYKAFGEGENTKISFPELDPEKFQKKALETGEKMGAGKGGINIGVLKVEARTKEDAKYISEVLRKDLKDLAEGVKA